MARMFHAPRVNAVQDVEEEHEDDDVDALGRARHKTFISTEAPQMYTSGSPMFFSASSTRMDTFMFVHKWNIGQYSVHTELSQYGDALESKVFGSADGAYAFKLKLFPAGKDEECKGFLSLFLQIMRCPSPKLRFRVNFYLDTADGPRGCALNKNVVSINKGGLVTASKFYSMETLKNRPQVYLPNDTLTIGVELTVFGDLQSVAVSIDDGEAEEEPDVLESGSPTVRRKATSPGGLDIPSASSAYRCDSIGECLTSLFTSEAFTDVEIVAGGHTFKVHKAILAARSSFFNAMFSHKQTTENKTGKVVLDDISAQVVQAVLQFIYSGKSDFSVVSPTDILAAADRFCLETLKRDCETALMRTNCLENVCDRLKLADLYHADRLRHRSLMMIFRNQGTILPSRDWCELEKQCPALAAATLKKILTMPEPFARRPSLADGIPALKRPRNV